MTSTHSFQVGQLVKDSRGRTAKIVRLTREDGVDFAHLTYPYGGEPQGLGYVTPGVWEHGVHDREVMTREPQPEQRPDCWGYFTTSEQGLRPMPDEDADPAPGLRPTPAPAGILGLTPGVLRRGMIVCAHGMRLLITETPRRTSHADGRTFATAALVLNREDVPSHRVPWTFTAQANGEHRWTLQGNDLARVAVELPR